MKRIFILSLVVVGAVLSGWYFLLGKPLNREIATISKELYAVEKKLTLYEKALASIPELMKKYDTMKTAIREDNSSLSGEEQVVRLYHTLDSLCRRPGYNLDEITPSLKEVIEFLREWEFSDSTVALPIRVKIEGKYRPLSELVEAVEKSPYFDSLTHCNIQGSEDFYPYCRLDLGFVARLNNRLEMFDFE